jgi:hypothetical protein
MVGGAGSAPAIQADVINTTAAFTWIYLHHKGTGTQVRGHAAGRDGSAAGPINFRLRSPIHRRGQDKAEHELPVALIDRVRQQVNAN